jgi:muramoyltetrapeptide carboxypeptidase
MIDSSPAAAHPIHGRLVGGNLSLCVSLLGTPFQPDFRKALIFLEDTGEEPYRVDRMMTHLRNAGAFSVASAVLLGSFTDCTPKDPSAPTLSVDEVMRDNAAATGVVHARGFPFGHGLPLATFPVGVRAALYPDSGKLVLLEAPVS